MKALFVFIALLPLGFAYYKLESAIDPIKMLYSYTGIGAMVLLLLSRLFPQHVNAYATSIHFLTVKPSDC